MDIRSPEWWYQRGLSMGYTPEILDFAMNEWDGLNEGYRASMGGQDWNRDNWYTKHQPDHWSALLPTDAPDSSGGLPDFSDIFDIPEQPQMPVFEPSIDFQGSQEYTPGYTAPDYGQASQAPSFDFSPAQQSQPMSIQQAQVQNMHNVANSTEWKDRVAGLLDMPGFKGLL